MTRATYEPYTRVSADDFVRILARQNPSTWTETNIRRALLQAGRSFMWSPYDAEATQTVSQVRRDHRNDDLWICRTSSSGMEWNIDWSAPYEQEWWND